MDDATKTEIEAAVFRRLRDHFERKPEIQNIDLMNLADFCRNCLAKWYRAEAEERGVDLDYDGARRVIYGMPYREYKAKHQEKAPAEKIAIFEEGEKRRAAEAAARGEAY
ncbi:MAG: deoxycytidine triphosphate deaminase [Rhodospirillaceae bacterium]|nr:deoxycytidine triphosphate deaminase [Rhodospirillaceae bacterium]|tara:strand:- start:11562 stop:11891 length:330 start_codon:yes stop_codon:yes gene_type:complete